MPSIALVQTRHPYHPYTQHTRVHPLGIMAITSSVREAELDDIQIIGMDKHIVGFIAKQDALVHGAFMWGKHPKPRSQLCATAPTVRSRSSRPGTERVSG